MKYTDEQLVTLISENQQRAVDYSSAALIQNREQAWNSFLVRPRGDELPGRSKIIDTSVRDAVHATLSTIVPGLDVENLCDFPPQGDGDADQADAEARVCNKVFRTTENLMQVSDALEDALLFRNGVLKIWVEDKECIEYRTYSGDAPALQVQLEESGYDVELTESTDEGHRFKLSYDEQRLRVKAIEQSYFWVDPKHENCTLQDCSYMSERVIFTRSELVSMGLNKKLVYELPQIQDDSITSGGVSNTDITAKYIDGQPTIGQAATTDQDHIECYWAHVLIDMDGDGIAEKWRFLTSNNRMLEKTPVSHFPYASGTCVPVPHRWSGLSLYDLLRVTADERTNAKRQLADNMNHANNQRMIADPATTNFQDLISSAPGRPIRSTDPAGGSFVPLQDITTNSIAYLQYLDGVRDEQAGSALDMASSDMQGMKDISGISAELQLGPAEQMAAWFSRNFCNSLVKSAFMLVHRCLREQWREPISFYKSGEWIEANPSQWRPRTTVNVMVALSPGERRRHVSALKQVLDLQMNMIAGGAANITTDWNGIHKTISDMMTAMQLDGTEGYFLDPDSQQVQQSMEQADAQNQQMQQMQQQMAMQQQQIESQKLELDKYKHDTEIEWKYYDTNIDAEGKEAELVQRGIESANSTRAESTADAGAG